MNRHDILSKRKQEKGQTLILGVMAILILVMSIIIFFDIQSVVRMKIKSQTALDAAALTGARWQQESLNMIGELNIVKACTVLITDFVGASTDSYLKWPEKVDYNIAIAQRASLAQTAGLLTQTQARICFMGPLLGFGAAQQAAKHNGLTYNATYGNLVSEKLMMLYSSIEEGQLSPTTHDFNWYAPYSNAVRSIYADGQGIAVGCNSHFWATPKLTLPQGEDSTFLYVLQSKYIYSAINSDYWCGLTGILRNNYPQKWWGSLQLEKDTSPLKESEYMPISVDFSNSESYFTTIINSGALKSVLDTKYKDAGLNSMRTAYDTYDPWVYNSVDGIYYKITNDTDSKYDPIPVISWAFFKSEEWYGYSETKINDWETYLRSSFRDGYKYNGAVAQMYTEIQPVTLSGSMQKVTGSDKYLGDALHFGGSNTAGTAFNAQAERIKYSENRRRNRVLNKVYSYATGKAFGRLLIEDTYYNPQAARFVLPVFDKVSLIPVSLEYDGSMNPFDYTWYAFLTEFLPALGTTDNLDDMPALMADNEHWKEGWFDSYYNALKKLNSAEWRQQGIDWLDTVNTREDESTYTNEDTCNDWNGSSGGGTTAGPAYGI